MTIRYVHNDPRAAFQLESQRASANDRPAGTAGFALTGLPPETVYPPGDERFVFWQAREAALAAVSLWESIDNPLVSWRDGGNLLSLIPNAGGGVGGSYTRSSIEFYSSPSNPLGFFTGASTDAVAHEVGHAILDTLRPALWDSVFHEVAALHESFGDCLTLLVAIDDDVVLGELFKNPAVPGDVLDQPNLLSTIAESVAEAVGVLFGPTNASSVARQLLNDRQWEIPTNLPPPTATNLSSEPHSFSRVFTGCFYDLINKIFKSGQHDAAGLQQAANTAGRLLASAVRTAPEEARFFRTVGRAMVLADRAGGGAHGQMIHEAFQQHGIALGSSAMLAPTAALAGPPPVSLSLNATTRSDLAARLCAPAGARIRLEAVPIAADPVWRAELRREVDLSAVHPELGGVVARASHGVLLGASGGRCAVLGNLPDAHANDEEAATFVAGLVCKGALDPGTRSSGPGRWGPSHVVHRRKGRSFLSRVRFSCGAGR